MQHGAEKPEDDDKPEGGGQLSFRSMGLRRNLSLKG